MFLENPGLLGGELHCIHKDSLKCKLIYQVVEGDLAFTL